MKNIIPVCIFFFFSSLKPFELPITLVASGPTCPNGHNGTIIVTSNGGVAPYTYTLNPGGIVSSSTTFTGLGPGTYTIVVTDAMGETGSTTIVLTEIGPYSSSYVDICSNQLPYTWNGQQYNSSGFYSMTFPGSAGCDSTATLELDVTTFDEWTGAVSNAWENSLNWSCGVPDSSSDVIISSGTVLLNSNATINSLDINSSANLTVNTGFDLTVLH